MHKDTWVENTDSVMKQFIVCTLYSELSRCRSVSIVSDYGLDDRAIGFRSPAEAKYFSSMWDFKFSQRRVWFSELSSGLYCRVKWLSTDVSEVRTASIIRDDFTSNLCVQTGSGAHPASYPMVTGGTFPGVKARSGRDADYSPHLEQK
jgi:hypothetical protein